MYDSLAPFLDGYLTCAVWASTDSDDVPLDRDYSESDFTRAAIRKAHRDCKDFLRANAQDLQDLASEDLARAGDDFWLTRNHHGAGFWDGDYPEDVGRRLTDSAHSFGSCDVIVTARKRLDFYP